ncbi:MAG: hypothetical protein GXO29_02960 [Thermotogae bacterium]|nr:hypothetical protein [Thermotogota bacterium]
MAKVKLEELFNIDVYERKARTKYEAIVVIGKYARYLLRTGEIKRVKLKDNPVIVAARKFVSEGIPFRRLESQENTPSESSDRS